MWLPQSPYLVMGSLRDQVTYPDRLKGASPEADAKVEACLRRAGLSKLLAAHSNGIHTEHADWSDVLSGGERQRVSFARLYYHTPEYAILDEATAAINPEEEAKL